MTCPESLESKVIDCLSKTSARSLVEVRHEGVSGMGDDGAEDTSDVAGSEGDHQLFGLGALGPGLGDHVLVKSLHGSLETGKLHHGVGDLSSPKRNQGLVETIEAFLLQNFWESSSQGCGEGSNWRSLNSDLARLHWRQSNVSKELSRSRGSQVEGCSVQEGVLLSDHVRVDLLEDLVESKLAETLGRVANGSGSPAKEESSSPTLGHGDLEAVTKRLVLLLVYLEPALDQVEGGDGGVGDAAGEDATEGTEGKVLGGTKLTAVPFVSCSSNNLSG